MMGYLIEKANIHAKREGKDIMILKSSQIWFGGNVQPTHNTFFAFDHVYDLNGCAFNSIYEKR